MKREERKWNTVGRGRNNEERKGRREEEEEKGKA